jgi:hypothetical protein
MRTRSLPFPEYEPPPELRDPEPLHPEEEPEEREPEELELCEPL